MKKWAACCCLAVALAACRGGDGPWPGAPVVLISIDTLRADRLPAWGYGGVATPAIDALAAEGVLFENAYAQVPLTFPSHASLLSGLLPPQAGVRSNVGYVFDAAAHPTLPGVLRAQGYATGAAVSAYVLRRETGLARDFDAYDDAVPVEESVTLGELQRPGDQAVRAALAWLDSQPKEKPPFVFLHLFEPHTPYAPPEPFRSRYRDPYVGEVAAADAIVGRFLDELRRRGRYDEALIVLLSDHGEGLGDHGEQEHGVLLYREALHVPLIVKLPGGSRGGQRVAAPVALVDVFPTVCAALSVDCPPGLPGRSLLGGGAADEAPERQIYSESLYARIHLGWSELRSLVDARYHYISGPDPELYDIAADPGEKSNLRDTARRELRERETRLAEIPLDLEAPAPADAEEAARLAALGYLGSVAAEPGGPRRDPKQHVQSLERVKLAHELTQSGRLREAVELCREILSEYPELVDVHTQLAATLRRLGRHDESLAAYREAVRLSPTLLDTLAVEIGKLELDRGRLEQAELHARQALTAYPLEAHLLLAGVELARRDLGAAEREARQAVGEASNPRPAALIFLARVLVEQGRLPEALEAVDRAAARIAGGGRPLPTLEATRGDVLARLGRSAEAEAAFRREIELFPRTTEAYVRLAILLAAERRFAEITPTLEAMVRAVPAPATFLLAARTLEDLGNAPAAASFRRRSQATGS